MDIKEQDSKWDTLKRDLQRYHDNLSLTKKVEMKRELRAILKGKWQVDDLAIVDGQIKTVSTHYV